MQSIYEVSIIPNNLRHEETIVQVADVLNYLCNVFDDIITKVNNRIDENQVRLSSLTERVNSSTNKIDRLTGTKKATQVFSSSKYPALDIHKRYKSMFVKSDENSVQLVRTKMKFKNIPLTEHKLEKLQFYHVKVNDKENLKSVHIEGLGTFPNNIEFINELLLFNTSKNPYKNYVMSDPLQTVQHTRETNETNVPGPDAAPLSITQRAALKRTVGETYFYSPGLGDVPSIDVPLDLPDLPGVADDLRYTMEFGAMIAPSVTTTPVVPELPPIVSPPTDLSITLENETHLLLPMSVSTPIITAPKLVDSIEIEKPQKVQEEFSKPVNKPVSDESVHKKTETALPVVEDARAGLMAAIRQAGGANKANLRNTLPKKEDKTVVSTNNLMADLNAKLALRRKGISGTKMHEPSEMNSALSRLSAMIPPPSASNDLNDSTNTEDEDWDE